MISPVVEFKCNSPVESIDIGVAAIVNPVVPSCVNVASLPAPNERTEESDSSFKSSPIIASLATLNPPSVCKEPSVVEVASVASSVFKIPPAVNAPVPTAPVVSIVDEPTSMFPKPDVIEPEFNAPVVVKLDKYL